MQSDALLKIRVGLPQRGGALVKAARDAGLPTLMSANAFAVYQKKGERQGSFSHFALPKPGAFDGLEIALDSAGFVVMSRYGASPWTIEQYVELAASAPWAWWASADMCCEPAVAGSKMLRRLRVAGSVRGYLDCARAADERGIKTPMPVLQGHTPEDYAECVDRMPLLQWPDLVGVGSVCRRELGGPDGLDRVIDAIDHALPKHVKLHLFGVKSTAVGVYAKHPRIASTDSAAWDYQARAKRRTGRTQAFRASEMLAWQKRQVERAQNCGGSQLGLLGAYRDNSESAFDESLTDWADLVASGDIDYQSAAIHAARELCYLPR